MEALGQVLSPLAGLSGRFESAMLAAAEQRQRDDEAQMASYFLGLKPLQQAVLWCMLAQGLRFRPYDAEALRFYREKTGLDTALSPQQAQNALESLRQRTLALVWKSARGKTLWKMQPCTVGSRGALRLGLGHRQAHEAISHDRE